VGTLVGPSYALLQQYYQPNLLCFENVGLPYF
jgi:hypothetical protein